MQNKCKAAYAQGCAARAQNLPYEANPYGPLRNPLCNAQWASGWRYQNGQRLHPQAASGVAILGLAVAVAHAIGHLAR